MKPEADLGVVDARLNVYGVTSLKIADLSIVPMNIGTVGSEQENNMDMRANGFLRIRIRRRSSLERRLR